MKLLFLATRDLSFYDSTDVKTYHGNVAEVSQWAGIKLLKCFPNNFFPVPIGLQKMGEPLHKAIKLSDISIVTIHYWPSDVLERNLLSYLPKEIEFIKLDNEDNKNWGSAAKALNYGIRKAKNDIIICAHEDLVFYKDWFESFIKQECRLKDWGAIGIVGMGFDRQFHWGSNYDVPYKVQSLDECCIIVNRKNNIWFDEETFKGFHCYGVDFCLQCYDKGLSVYVVSGPAGHGANIRGYNHSEDWMPNLNFAHKALKKKWEKHFPSIATTTGIL